MNHHHVQVQDMLSYVTRPHQTLSKVGVTITTPKWNSCVTLTSLPRSRLSHVAGVSLERISPILCPGPLRDWVAPSIPLTPASMAVLPLLPALMSPSPPSWSHSLRWLYPIPVKPLPITSRAPSPWGLLPSWHLEGKKWARLWKVANDRSQKCPCEAGTTHLWEALTQTTSFLCAHLGFVTHDDVTQPSEHSCEKGILCTFFQK